MKKRKRRKKLLGIILIGLFIYSFKLENNSMANMVKDIFTNIFTSKESIAIDGNEIYSETGLLLDLEEDKILYRKNINEKIYPASLTKIMTTIVALENIGSLDDKILLTEDDFEGVYESGAAVAGFRSNEIVSKRDLLYGMMLPSGADAVNGIVNNLGGKKHFIKLMNDKAKELGMNKTNFTNATGLHDENHYSSVSDLSKLLKYALENGDFKAIISKREYVTETTGLRMTSRVFDNLEEDKIDGYRLIGGKTGYTESAGLCLASVAEKKGKEYILITTGAGGGPDTVQYNFLDCYNIYNNYIE